MAPHYCPYCGEQDLRPTPDEGQWECRDCARVFAVRFVGLAAEPLAAVDQNRTTALQEGVS
jgi:ribosomal protein L37AE/L43A